MNFGYCARNMVSRSTNATVGIDIFVAYSDGITDEGTWGCIRVAHLTPGYKSQSPLATSGGEAASRCYPDVKRLGHVIQIPTRSFASG